MNQLVGRKGNGTKFLMLVLEPANLHKLQQDLPIVLRVEDSFPDGIPRKLELVIAFSETPVADGHRLAGAAEVVLDERTPVAAKKRPHCPECRSTIEQMSMMTPDQGPVATLFCPMCGCLLGFSQKGEKT